MSTLNLSMKALAVLKSLRDEGPQRVSPGPLIATLTKKQLVTFSADKYQITDVGERALAEALATPAPQPRQRRTLLEHEPQPAEVEEVTNLAGMLADAVEVTTGETVQSVEVHIVNGEQAGDEQYGLSAIVQIAAAVSDLRPQDAPPAQPNSYIRVDISLERPLDEARLFELYPDLGAMVAAIRSAGGCVQVFPRVNVDVRGYQQ